MRVGIYTKIVREVSGVQTFEKNFLAFLSNFPEIETLYVFDAGRRSVVRHFASFADEAERNEGQPIDVDLLFCSSLERCHHNIRAKKTCQIYHTSLSEWNLNPTKGVDYHIAVGSAVARDLVENFNEDAIELPNIIFCTERKQRAVRLLTASRIARGKGFDRMQELAKALDFPFVWEVYGSGRRMFELRAKDRFDDVDEVVFMGERRNILPHVFASDFVVQLSDNEGFCYTVNEALSVGKPVVVTNWEGVEKYVSHGKNGYILEKDMSNIEEVVSRLSSHHHANLLPSVEIKQKATETNQENIEAWTKFISKF